MAIGAVMSAPLLTTPCGSSVPVGSRTVVIFEGTTSRNSIQLIRSISRVETTSFCCAATVWQTASASARAASVRFMRSPPAAYPSAWSERPHGEVAERHRKGPPLAGCEIGHDRLGRDRRREHGERSREWIVADVVAGVRRHAVDLVPHDLAVPT